MNVHQKDSRFRQRSWMVSFALRAVWPLFVQDVTFPGSSFIERAMTDAERQRLGRERIAYQIRNTQFRLGYGPMWLKRFAQWAHEIRLSYGFWFFAVLKVLASIVVVGLPLAALVVFRVVLPDPRPLLDQQLDGHSFSPLVLGADHPKSFDSPYHLSLSSPGWQPEDGLLRRGLWDIRRLKDAKAPDLGYSGLPYLVLTQEGQGPNWPKALLGAALSADGFPVTMVRNSPQGVTSEVAGANRVLGHYRLLSPLGEAARCRLEIYDEAQRVLLAVEKNVGGAALRLGWLDDVVGDELQRLRLRQAAWDSFRIRTDVVPARLTFSVRDTAATKVQGATPRCAAAIAAPLFERRRLHPLALGSVVLVVVDGVWEAATRWTGVMPQWHSWTAGASDVVRSSSHFASSTQPDVAWQDLLGGAKTSGLPSGPSLFGLARRAGLRTGFFGAFEDAFWQNHDRWESHDLPDVIFGHERDGYRNVGSLVQALEWLKSNPGAPAFAVVRWSELRGGWMPPFSAVTLSDLAIPFMDPFDGYKRQRLHYQTMLRALDQDFGRLRKLWHRGDFGRGLGLEGASHLVVVGLTGASVAPKVLAVGAGLGAYATGASFSLDGRGELFPDQIHVPMMASSEGTLVKPLLGKVTSHRDLKTAMAALLTQSPGALVVPTSTVPLAITLKDRLGVLDEPANAEVPLGLVHLWTPAQAVVGQSVSLSDFPARAKVRRATGMGGLEYDTSTGQITELRPDQRVQRFTGSLPAWDFVAPRSASPALILGTASTAEVSVVVDVASGREPPLVTWLPLERGASEPWPSELHRQLGPGALVIEGRLPPGALALWLSGEQAMGIRVNSAAGLRICGRAQPDGRLQWSGRHWHRFLFDPPKCALSHPGRMWYDVLKADDRIKQQGMALSVGWP